MEFKQGHALLVGVGTHEHHAHLDVPITIKDAEGVASILKDPGQCGYPPAQVQVISEAEATKDGILSALDVLAKQAGPDDTVFFFYCGHGTLGTDGKYYLVSHDARIDGLRVKAGTGVSEIELLDKLRNLKAERLLLIFNACHSGFISPSLDVAQAAALDVTNPPEDTAAALLGTGSGRIIMVACREGQYSYIGSGPNTIFTSALMDGLRGRGVRSNHGFISAFSLYEHLYDTVKEVVRDEIKEDQEPELTVLKGVGPFAVSLYKGATTLGTFDENEKAREDLPIKTVKPEKSQRYFEQRIVHTGGGAYIKGNVKTGGGDFVGQDQITLGDKVTGDKVGGDKISVGDITGSTGIAIGRGAQSTVTEGVSAEGLAELFSQVYKLIETRKEDPNVDKPELVETVKRIEEESQQGEKANEHKLERWFESLAKMAPDILEVTLNALINPAAGAATVVRKVAEKARSFKHSGSAA